jgi:hypothetical protein
VQCGGKSVAGLRQIKIALASKESQISITVAEEMQIAQTKAKVLKVS